MKTRNNFQRIVFPNGFTVLLYKINSVLSVNLSLSVRIGSSGETEKESGLSHFTEHAVLLGTKSFPNKLTLSRFAQNIGAAFDGRTNRLQTFYWVNSPYFNFNKSLKILYELAFSPILDSELIINERGPVTSEFNDFWQNNERRFWFEFWQKRFKEKNHPYSTSILGNLKTINTFEKEDVTKWMETYYHPNNMFLTVVGNLNISNVEQQVKQLFDKHKSGRNASVSKIPVDNYSNFLIYHNDFNKSQISFSLLFPAFGTKEISKKERLALQILNFVLGRGSASRLFQNLRQKNGLVYSVASYCNMFEYAGVIEIISSTSDKNILKAITEIKQEIIKLVRNGITQEELDLARNYLNYSLMLSFDNPGAIANFISNQELEHEDIWFPEDYKKESEKITVKEINRLIKGLFDFSKLNVGLFGNLSQQTINQIKEVLTEKE